MVYRAVNAAERYLLANYQHLMTPADRMIARSLVAADFDLNRIPRGVWQKVSADISGVDPRDPWKLPIQICLRLLKEHRGEVHIPDGQGEA
jgi:hypothetical protein